MTQSNTGTQQTHTVDQSTRSPGTGSQWLPQIDPNLCNGCGLCIELCPSQALGWRKILEASLAASGPVSVAALVQPDRCNYCATCETVCPTDAIELPYLVCKREPAAEPAAL